MLKKILSALMALFLLFLNGVMQTNVNDEHKTYKNVILMIGDGMGDNSLAVARQKYDTDLAMDSMPVYGHSNTNSFLKDYTDSAAGATALACGVRTWNQMVSRFPYFPLAHFDIVVPMTLCELAKSNGKSAGVVTTDQTSGATPAAFSAHAIKRNKEKDISTDQLKSDLDLIWGCDTETITKSACEEYGFTYVSTKTELMALESGSRSIAQFDFDSVKNVRRDNDSPMLVEMTEKAIDLLDDNEEGFFLMIEGACIDKFNHENNFEGSTKNTIEFSKAIQYALDYAKADGETLVVVTADHETGGITYDEAKDEYYYTTGDHTTADVPLFVSATDAGFTDGERVENRQISGQIARVMGFDKKQFPAVKGYSYEVK